MDSVFVVLGLHAPFVAAAVVLLAVPSWRRWLLSQTWSPILFIIAGYGAFYTAIFWPDALGGWSVGFPLVLALVAGLLIWMVLMFINEWRSDRRSAIELLAMMTVTCASVFAAERLVGKDYWWLALVPVLAYSTIRWLLIWRRSRRGEPS